MRIEKPAKLIAILVLISQIALAGAISPNSALEAAGIFLEVHPAFAMQPGKSLGPFSIADLTPVNSPDGTTLAYIAGLAPKGYIAVAADTDIEPIIAYSVEGDFVFDDSPQNKPLRMLEADIALRLQAKAFVEPAHLRANNALWNSYLNRDKAVLGSVATTTVWGPWIDTNWGQSAPYNDLCPMDPAAGERAVTGCVATAMCQIVDYWEWPPSVSFNSSDSYWSEYTTPRIWIDATTASIASIDYRGAGRYPDNATIAALMFACGVSVEMQYSAEGSSSDTRNVPPALLNKFDYASAKDIIIMTTGFYDSLKANIFVAQPVELGIGGMDVGGHAIVADGWDSATNLYHLNMGWSGYANGWYSLPSGMPEGFTIVGHQATNIVPPVITRRPPVDLKGKSITGGYIQLQWSRPFNITEPVIGYKVYRKGLYDTFYTYIGTTIAFTYTDLTVEELTGYTYAVSADYSAGESEKVEITLYSGIYGGWSRTFGGAGDQIPSGIAPAPGFGCVAVGFNTPAGSLDKDGYILRTVAGSSQVWERSLDLLGRNDAFTSVVTVNDSFYVAAGYTEFGGVSDILIAKFDDSGDTVWTSRLEDEASSIAMSLVECPDGGFMLAGYSLSGSVETGLLVKTDALGRELWRRQYLPGTRFNSLAKAAGGFIAVGQRLSGALGLIDAHVVRVDDAGDTLWTRDFGGALDDVANSISPTNDGGFAVAGKTKSFGMPIFNSMLILKIDDSGNEIWLRTYVKLGDFEANSVFTRMNGNIFAAGSGKFNGNIDVYTRELSADGDSISAHIYGTDASDVGYAAIELADTGVVIACKTFNLDNNDFWILKIGGDLYSKVDEGDVSLPSDISAISAFPNPFNSVVRIEVPFETARVEVFDLAGRRVETIWPSTGDRGAPVFVWSPSASANSGVYLVRAVSAEGRTATGKIILLK